MELNIPRRVEIEVNGETLVHYFKDLRGAEWLEHQRLLGQIAESDDLGKLKQVMAVYDARCERVEGYAINGHDLMEITGDELAAVRASHWRDMIPGDHKCLAWTELVGGAKLKKNS